MSRRLKPTETSRLPSNLTARFKRRSPRLIIIRDSKMRVKMVVVARGITVLIVSCLELSSKRKLMSKINFLRLRRLMTQSLRLMKSKSPFCQRFQTSFRQKWRRLSTPMPLKISCRPSLVIRKRRCQPRTSIGFHNKKRWFWKHKRTTLRRSWHSPNKFSLQWNLKTRTILIIEPKT